MPITQEIYRNIYTFLKHIYFSLTFGFRTSTISICPRVLRAGQSKEGEDISIATGDILMELTFYIFFRGKKCLKNR